MLLVIVLALAASTSAAASSVLKHRSAQQREQPAWTQRLPRTLASMVGNPLFPMAVVADIGCAVFQIAALRYGDISIVQPMLSSTLVITLVLGHLVARTHMSKTETLYASLLMASLVLLLTASGATTPNAQEEIGRRTPAIILAVLGTLTVGGAYLLGKKRAGLVQARALAVAVAIVYATTAGLMKSTTHIVELRGIGSLLLSWQLWTLIGLVVLGLFLNQMAFAAGPLRVSMPIIASLDPLFSVLIGMGVYGETLRSTPGAIVGEVVGFVLLTYSVIGLSRIASTHEERAVVEEAAARRGQ